MTPEAARFLQNADDHLERGQTMLVSGLNHDAARAAYLAAFHAAQAIIFERTGKVFKSHKGVNVEFLRLTKNDPHFTQSSGGSFPERTNSKPLRITTAGPIAEVLSGQAAAAIEAARRFVATVRRELTLPPPN